MRITSAQYAKSLYAVTFEKSHEKIDILVANFVKVLAKNGQLKLKTEILRKFEVIFNLKNEIVVAETYSREKLSDDLAEKLKNYIKAKYLAKEVMVKNIIDEKIKGGVIVKVGDEIFDASVQGQLKKLKNILNN